MRSSGGKTTRRRHKRVLKRAKGYYGAKSTLYRRAKEATVRSMAFAYKHRRERKRDFRRLWIVRINAAARQHGLAYNRFMEGLHKAGVELNRKVLSELAVNDPTGFAMLAKKAKLALGQT